MKGDDAHYRLNGCGGVCVDLTVYRLDIKRQILHNSQFINAPVAQLDRVPGYELGGREFESLRARQLPSEVLGMNRLFPCSSVGRASDC